MFGKHFIFVGVITLALMGSGCAAFKEAAGYDRYEWDENLSYIDEPHRLPCKQRSTKDAPRLCDGRLVSQVLEEKRQAAAAKAARAKNTVTSQPASAY